VPSLVVTVGMSLFSFCMFGRRLVYRPATIAEVSR
jgi:hypothetical protein